MSNEREDKSGGSPKNFQAVENKGSGLNSVIEKLLLGVLLLPGFISSVIVYYFGFYKMRLKPSVMFFFSLPLVTAFTVVVAKSVFLSKGMSWDSVQVLIDYSYESPLKIVLWIAGIIFAWGIIAGTYYAQRTKKSLDNNEYRVLNKNDYFYKWKGFRRGPLESLMRKRRISKIQNGELNDEDRTAIGIDENDNVLYLYNDELRKPTAIFGASGSGKTKTMLSMIKKDIDYGMPLLVIDMKGSRELATKLAKWTSEAGGTFYHFMQGSEKNYDVPYSTGQSYYDPLITAKKVGNTADILLNLREWDVSANHYKTALANLLQLVVSVFRETDFSDPAICLSGEPKPWQCDLTFLKFGEGELSKIESAINSRDFKKFATEIAKFHSQDVQDGIMEVFEEEMYHDGLRMIPRTVRKEIDSRAVREPEISFKLIDFLSKAEVDKPKSQSAERNALNALQTMIGILVSSSYGKWLKVDSSGKVINIEKLLSTEGSVILFSLNSDAEADFVRYFSTLLLSDVKSVSTSRRNTGSNDICRMYIDEFQIVSSEALAPLLEKARESGINIIVSAQSPEQIATSATVNGESYKKSVFDTCSNFLIHNGMTQDSAEEVSKLVGKESVVRPGIITRRVKYFKLFTEMFDPLDDSKAHAKPGPPEYIISPRRIIEINSPLPDGSIPAGVLCIKKSPVDRSDGNIEWKFADIIVPSREVVSDIFSERDRNEVGEIQTLDDKVFFQDDTVFSDENTVETDSEDYFFEEDDGNWEIEEVEEDDFVPIAPVLNNVEKPRVVEQPEKRVSEQAPSSLPKNTPVVTRDSLEKIVQENLFREQSCPESQGVERNKGRAEPISDSSEDNPGGLSLKLPGM